MGDANRLSEYRPQEFAVAGPGDWDQCLAEVGRQFAIQPEPSRRVVRTFYDTFDWRLYRCGQVLCSERCQSDPALKLVWRDTRSAQRAALAIAEVPQFAASLPARLRLRLGTVIEPRALLAVLELRGRVRAASVLDADAKTVARLEQAVWTVHSNGHARGKLGVRVTLEPLRGYANAAARVAEALAAGGADADVQTVLTAGLTRLDRFPGDYSSKLKVALDPEHTAQQASIILFRHLLETLQRNEEGVRSEIDVEFLHDFRVAIRRTRALLGQCKRVFAAQALKPFRAEFAWLARETGEKRDLDVLLLEYQRLDRAAFALLLDHLEQRRRRAGDRLNQVLAGQRYRQLVENWAGYLDTVPTSATGPLSDQPVSEFAGARIWRVYRRAIREGQAIHADSPSAALHELRKTCKKLRYLLEAYQSLYPPRLMVRRIKQLRRLQDQLGRFQDHSMQRSYLARAGRELAGANPAAAELLMEIGGMLERSRVARERVGAACRESFADFAANRQAFARLFKP